MSKPLTLQDWYFTNLKKMALTNCNSFPPFNLFRQGDIDILELAVAGFKKEDLSIKIENEKLHISGTKTNNQIDHAMTEVSDGYFHRGIAGRSFTKTFYVDRSTIVESAKLEDGILTVRLLSKAADNSIEIEIS